MKTYFGKINNLKENYIIVIGTNPLGINGSLKTNKGGSALFCLKKGWIKQGEKLNNCLSKSKKVWGLVTVSGPGKKRSKSPEQIKNNILRLYEYADKNKDKYFFIAYTGTNSYNLNGYTNLELADMFSSFMIPNNIIFEREFSTLINNNN